MKRTTALLAITLALFAASPAHSDDIDRHAFAMAYVVTYDLACESLPIDFSGPVAEQMLKIPDATIEPVMLRIYTAYRRDGREEFCARAKPHIEKWMADMYAAVRRAR